MAIDDRGILGPINPYDNHLQAASRVDGDEPVALRDDHASNMIGAHGDLTAAYKATHARHSNGAVVVAPPQVAPAERRRGHRARVDRALPLTRGQLDIWLAQETGHSGTEWQLGLFVRIEGPVERDALEWAIRRVVREAEPGRAAFFEVDGQVFQRAIDYPDVELAFYDLSCSRDPVQEARRIASSIQRTPMPFTGPLFKFALFRTRPDEFYLFACGHHIVIDGTGIALVGHRIASVYSAIVSGAPIPPAFFGSLQDLVDCELEYEASSDYLDDQAYWTRNLPAESGAGLSVARRRGRA